MLHPAIGKNRYCGPGAMAMLLGVTTDEAAAAIRARSGQKYVKGAKKEHVVNALTDLGATVQFLCSPLPRKVQLREWASGLRAGRFLVNVTGHYVAVDASGEFVEIGDNQSVTARTVTEFRRGGKYVKHIWMVQ